MTRGRLKRDRAGEWEGKVGKDTKWRAGRRRERKRHETPKGGDEKEAEEKMGEDKYGRK